MSNAAKYRKKAAEFEQTKQIDRAIAAYIQAIEESESAGEDVDVALFNKVGDLALRRGRVPDAITYYERAIEHYATSGLFNNAIALCNKVLRSAPGRANVYFTLGRICARKGLRGDATKNFLEYATRMREEGKVEEGMRALAEIADLSPELTEIRKFVDEYAERAGIALPRRHATPLASPAIAPDSRRSAARDERSPDLVFIHMDYRAESAVAPPRKAPTPPRPKTPVTSKTPVSAKSVVDPLQAALIEPGPGLALLRAMAATETTGPSSAPPVPPAQPSPMSPASPEPAGVAADEETLIDFGALAELPALDYPTFDTPDLDAPVIDLPPADVPGAVETTHATSESAAPAAPSFDGLPLLDVMDGLGAPEDLRRETIVEPLDGLTVDEAPSSTEPITPLPVEGMALVPRDLETMAFGHVELLDEVVVEEFEHAADDPTITRIIQSEAGVGAPPAEIDATPLDLVPTEPTDVRTADARAADAAVVAEPLDIEPVPEIDAAIRDGHTTAASFDAEHASVGPVTVARMTPLMLEVDLAGIEEDAPSTRPPFRVDPHDFILPGELPPLLLDDAIVEAGLAAHDAPSPDDAAAAERGEAAGTPRFAIPSIAESVEASLESRLAELGDPASTRPSGSATVRPTPALPIKAVAAEATLVASSRRDALRGAVERLPRDWMLRRRLAEALLEAGEREEALLELETARQGLLEADDLVLAAEITDELVHVAPERIAYHQRRVEIAVRTHDLQRLRYAYLDLADALVRLGEEGRARAVYARVLEIDPLDDRARTALGAAAPPPPPPSAPADDEYVDLTTWLKDDDGHAGDTRLRMREPVISGDEQADFDELLRHFKDGVARSLGEDDFESHYDLGVAYKEMGLLDDAVAEFQKALRSRGNRLPAYEALGQCFVEQGRHQIAATVLSRALHEPGVGDEHRVGVLYLLAFSCEALHRTDEARSYYQRVYAIDIHFRDVASRLATLEHVAQ